MRIDQLFSDDPLIVELGKSVRDLLDGPEGIRNEVIFYLEKLDFLKKVIETADLTRAEERIFPLDEIGNTCPLSGIKFLYSFYFEALVWFIQTESGKLKKGK